MDNERLKILKMLEDGMINADQAATLLEASKRPDHTGERRESSAGYGNDNTGHARTGPGFDDITSDLSRKFEAFARDFQPKLKMATEMVVEKTADIAGRISRSIDAEIAKPGASSAGSASSLSFQRRVTESGGELHIAGLNAPVNLRGYNGDTVSLDIKYRAKRPHAYADGDIQFKQHGGKYSLAYDEHAFESVAVDAFVPSSMFGNISAQTVHGGLTVSGVTCVNGRFDNFNGDVSITDLDIQNLGVSTSNSAISVNMSSFSVFKEYVWAVETSNAPISLNLPTPAGCGYHIRAHAALGDIRLGVAGMSFLYDDGSNMEAKSLNYDAKPIRVMMSLETSYASIEAR